MTKTNEYIERRCSITEQVLCDFGKLVAAHMPAMQPHLRQMYGAWDRAIEKLDEEFPDTETPNAEISRPAQGKP